MMSLPPLAPQFRNKPVAFELRMSLLFAAVLAPLGIHVPYFPLWLDAKGFDAAQIAVVLSAPLFLRVATTPFITALADRAGDRANVLIALVAATTAISCGYFLPPTYGTVVVVSLALSVVWTPQGPLVDSLALSGVRRFGSSYPAMRIWGSIFYLLATFGGGLLLADHDPGIIPVMITAGAAVTLLASLIAPRLGPPRMASPLSATEIGAKAPKLLDRFFVLFVGGAGLIIASHGFMNGFVSIYWHSVGLSGPVIGALWAWGVVAEVGMFLGFTRIFSKVSTTRVIAVAGIGAIVRWIAFPLVWPAGLGLFGFGAVQALHALSTALILIGVQRMIAETVPERRIGAAQGIYFFANGFSSAAVTLISGPLYAAFGVDGFFAMAVVAAAGLVMIMLAGRSSPQKARGRLDD